MSEKEDVNLTWDVSEYILLTVPYVFGNNLEASINNF